MQLTLSKRAGVFFYLFIFISIFVVVLVSVVLFRLHLNKDAACFLEFGGEEVAAEDLCSVARLLEDGGAWVAPPLPAVPFIFDYLC